MTLEQFIAKYSDKFIDYDNAYGPQCVDLCKAYMDEVLELGEIGSIGNAKELTTNLPTLYPGKFTIHKGLTGIQKGDIIISTNGGFGHVAIYIRTPSTGKVEVLNQN